MTAHLLGTLLTAEPASHFSFSPLKVVEQLFMWSPSHRAKGRVWDWARHLPRPPRTGWDTKEEEEEVFQIQAKALASFC